jgi:hypothetical protein
MDRFDVAVALVAIIQLQRMFGFDVLSNYHRLALLVLLSYPHGVWWLRQVDWNVSPLWSAWSVFAVLSGLVMPIIWVRLLWEAA